MSKITGGIIYPNIMSINDPITIGDKVVGKIVSIDEENNKFVAEVDISIADYLSTVDNVTIEINTIVTPSEPD